VVQGFRVTVTDASSNSVQEVGNVTSFIQDFVEVLGEGAILGEGDSEVADVRVRGWLVRRGWSFRVELWFGLFQNRSLESIGTLMGVV
jgi:hypothetical protein